MKLISRIFPKFTQHSFSSPKLNGLLEMHGIMADVGLKDVRSLANVICADGTEVKPGCELLPQQLVKEPSVNWKCERNSYYFLCMLDPDMPSRRNPTYRHWLNWLVGNIPGCNMKEGNVYTEYVKPSPEEHTGLHRCLLLIYKQPEVINFPFQLLTVRSLKRRSNFSMAEVARKYKLYRPVAANFFHTKFDIYAAMHEVPKSREHIKTN